MARKGRPAKRYPAAFKAKVIARMQAGESVMDLQRELKISNVTLYGWAGRLKGKNKPPRIAARHGKVNGHGATVPSTFTTLVRAAQADAGQAHDDTLLLTLRTWLRDGWRWVEAKQASGEFDHRSEPDRGHLMLQLALSEIEKATQGRRK